MKNNQSSYPKVIDFYSRKPLYGFLSNFHRCPQVVDDNEYPTNEHFYQSMKARDWKVRAWIASAPTPYLAMVAGRKCLRQKDMVHDWDDRRIPVMLKGLRAKFNDPHLRNRLLDTGDAILHEDSPTDMFWGKKGEDWLGRLLMRVREEIRLSPTTARKEE